MGNERLLLLEWFEAAVAQFDMNGYRDMAKACSLVVEALHRGETVWAVVVADAYDLGPDMVERLRRVYGVRRISEDGD